MRKIAPSIGLFFVGSLFLSTIAWTQEAEDKNNVPPSPVPPESSVSHEQKPQEPAALSQKATEAKATEAHP